MKKGLIYIHGKGGSSEEAEHYKPLFPEYDVVGFDYRAETPWEAKEEFLRYYDAFCQNHTDIILVANSIGAYFALNSLGQRPIRKAFLISPVVNMEKLICDMLLWAGTDEAALREKGTIATAFGETLSWQYLSWVRQNPIRWQIPTAILYGSRDNLQSYATVLDFAKGHNAALTVMEGGEHWFHTREQMEYLDGWIKSAM